MLVVAIKLKEIKSFLKATMDSLNGKLPGALSKNLAPQTPPGPNSSNFRHKVFHAFWHACKKLDRDILEVIFDHVELLGESSFIDAISSTSKHVRVKVANTLVKHLMATNQLKDVT